MNSPRFIAHVFSGFDRCWKILSRTFDQRFSFWAEKMPASTDTAELVSVANLSTGGSLTDNPFQSGNENPIGALPTRNSPVTESSAVCNLPPKQCATC